MPRRGLKLVKAPKRGHAERCLIEDAVSMADDSGKRQRLVGYAVIGVYEGGAVNRSSYYPLAPDPSVPPMVFNVLLKEGLHDAIERRRVVDTSDDYE